MQTSQIEVMSRYLTLIEPRRKARPSERRYSSKIAGIAKSQVGLGATPLMRANIMMTPKLISILMTAVRVAETTTTYFGKLILRRRSPRLTMA